MKKILLWTLGLILVLFWGLYFSANKNRVSCPDINPIYGDFFPYCKDRTIQFRESDSIRTYTILEFEISHTDSYNSMAKCGYCADSVWMVLIGQADTFVMSIQNIDNPDSYFGEDISVYRNGFQQELIQRNDSVFEFENILLKRGIGIESIKWNDKTWHLKEKKTGEAKIEHKHC